jgi:putative tricarboxylic transport membrane protein
MAKRGRAGPALGIAAFGSFIAGTLGIGGLMIFATPLSEYGLKFGPPEFFAVIFLGLTLTTYLSHGSVIKGLIMGAFGLVLSSIGLDPIDATPRMTFDVFQLWDGIEMVPLAMGLYGIAEVLINIEETTNPEILKTKIKNLLPNMSDWMRSAGPILRGTVLGFFLGILPGGGTVLSSFLSYALEKRISKNPEQFGKGAIEGVAGPESANNSATSGGFVPLLTLGIPCNITMAMFFGALMIHGIRPGPLLLKNRPDLFWGVISSMYIGNVMLLVLNLPLIPIWVRVLKVPYRILYPLILLFCIVGAYSIKNSVFDVLGMVIAGMVGYLFRKYDYESAPLILAFILGPMFELNLRHSLLFSKGSFVIFFTRPISAVAIALSFIFLTLSLLSNLLKKKEKDKPSIADD